MNNEEERKVVTTIENNNAIQNNNQVTSNPNIETEIANIEEEKLNNQVENQQQEIPPIQPIQTIQPVQPTEQINTVNRTENVLKVENKIQEQSPISQSNPNETNTNTSTNQKTEVKDDYKGPSTFRKITTVLLFIFLFLFVYFLGDITEYINAKKEEKQISEVTNGKLTCTSSKASSNLDIKLNAVFTFENKKITNLTYTITSTGDKQKDVSELNKLNNDCKVLEEEVKDLDGIRVICSLNNGVNSVKQIFNYEILDNTKVSSAFAEAGGIYPQFKYKDDIDKVNSKMLTSGYTCEKMSS